MHFIGHAYTFRPPAPPDVRLDRYLHEAGLGTRREVGRMIREGRVAVGGAPASSGADHVPAGSPVTVDGAPVAIRGPRVVAFHKPPGLVTSTRDRLPTVYARLPYSPEEMRPVGRLDRETEGLLLLTDDGLLLHRLTSPRWHVEKEYLALV
ncbi:MAG TPA: pseudouridine synthase, partial [Planctomycetota bacterium]|nr:pseudouridine synthase [Planctomycetota bacterium]